MKNGNVDWCFPIIIHGFLIVLNIVSDMVLHHKSFDLLVTPRIRLYPPFDLYIIKTYLNMNKQINLIYELRKNVYVFLWIKADYDKKYS